MLISCYQALVMLVQNRYQRRRMYTRIALGKNSAMDVVSGESSGMGGQLLLLYPLLFGAGVSPLLGSAGGRWEGVEERFSGRHGQLREQRRQRACPFVLCAPPALSRVPGPGATWAVHLASSHPPPVP
jgi:hypothetical protein